MYRDFELFHYNFSEPIQYYNQSNLSLEMQFSVTAGYRIDNNLCHKMSATAFPTSEFSLELPGTSKVIEN